MRSRVPPSARKRPPIPILRPLSPSNSDWAVGETMNLVWWLFFGLLLSYSDVRAQTATLNGTTSDESGALVPGAKITLAGSDGSTKSVISSPDGSYAFTNLSPGTYVVQATAPQLATQPVRVTIRPGPPQSLNIQLRIVSALQEVNIQSDTGSAISTEAAETPTPWSCAGAIWTRSPTIPRIWRPICRRSPDRQRVQAVEQPSSMDSAAVNFPEKFDPGDPHQPESVFTGVRQAGVRPY